MSLSRVRDLNAEAQRLASAGDPQGALAAARTAVDLCRSELGEDHYAYPLALATLGWTEHTLATPGTAPIATAAHAGAKARADAEARADAAFAETERRARALAQDDFEHARVALTHVLDYRLARCAQAAAAVLPREQAAAEGLLRELLALTERSLGGEHPRYFSARARLEAFVSVMRQR